MAVKLSERLRDYIVSNELQPGDRLPSETQLSTLFEAGRTSVREALKLLEQEGLVQSRQGMGRFVTNQTTLDRPLTRLEGVTEMLASRGWTATNEVLSVSLADPTTSERQALELEPGAAVVRLERLRKHDDVALVYSIDVFDRSLLHQDMAEVDWSGSLFSLLGGNGHHIDHAVVRVQAAELPEAAAVSIQGAPEPWLLLVQTHLTPDGMPLLHSYDYHRGADFNFHLIRRRS